MAWLWHTRPVKQCASKAVGLSGCFYRIHSAVLKDCVSVYVHDWQLCVFYLTFTLPKFEIVCLPQSTSQHFPSSTILEGLECRKEKILFGASIHDCIWVEMENAESPFLFSQSIYTEELMAQMYYVTMFHYVLLCCSIWIFKSEILWLKLF